MNDESRPAPQYGEYATPDEVAALRGTPAPPDPAPRQAEPVAEPTVRPRRWDLLLTIGLLVLGLLWTAGSMSGFLDYSTVLNESATLAGVQISFGDDADAAGLIVLVVDAFLLLAAIGASAFLLGRGRLAFWVPITAGVLAFASQFAIFLILVLGNPTYSAILFDRP